MAAEASGVLASLAVVTIKRNSVEVNGEPLPFFIGPHVRIDVDRNDVPRVTIEILADRVDIDDSYFEGSRA